MEIKQKLKVNNESLRYINKGYNFLNVDDEKKVEKKYHISVLLVTRQNIRDTEEKIIVQSDLLDYNYYHNPSYYGSPSVEKFLIELEEFVKLPFVKIKKTDNRINTDRYDRDMGSLESHTRDGKIIFSEIEITIGELAKEKMDIDLKKEVKRILNLQEETDDKNQKLMDRFVYLKEKVLTLKSFIRNDNTFKTMITDEEYKSGFVCIIQSKSFLCN